VVICVWSLMHERPRYSTDLTDAQWALLQPFFPVVDRVDHRNGRPRVYAYREILNGIFYILRSGGAWSLMPHDLPPWLTCYGYFNRWSRNGLWERLHAALREADRVREQHDPTPSAAVLDSQSVKTTEKGGAKQTMTSAMTRTRKSKAANATSS
jgi:putative transposase